MKSIKGRLVKGFVFVILITIIMLDLLLLAFIRKYYYDNMYEMLKSQVQISTKLYKMNYSHNSLYENIYDNSDAFWDQSSAEVQIFDLQGNLIMDSIGAYEEGVKYPDVIKSLQGERYNRWVGDVSYYDNKVMSVSTPLESDGNIIGVIRLTVSLRVLNEATNKIALFFTVLSSAVLVLGIVVSGVIANNIVNPIKQVTKVAEEMAEGNLLVRNESDLKDEIGKLAKTLDYMAEEINNREQLKNEFISSISHELRTPLTAIKGWVITLEDDKTDKEIMSLGLNIIEKETDRLVNMVEELLDFSRLVSGKMSLNKKLISIKQIEDYIEINMAARAKREDKIFTVKGTSSNVEINVDFNRIKQVLINLVDNAFKFTEGKGEISISFTVEKDFLTIRVIDNGCGISKNDMPRVKEKFYKGKNSKSTNGIGLSICEEIITLHRGEFKIFSEEGKGTEVKVILPLYKGEGNEKLI